MGYYRLGRSGCYSTAFMTGCPTPEGVQSIMSMTRFISVRCKLDEQQAIVAGAEAAGQTVSAFMRAAAVDRAERLLTIAEAAEARGETFSEFYEAAAMRRAEQVLGKKRF